jgi:hypothetical protein
MGKEMQMQTPTTSLDIMLGLIREIFEDHPHDVKTLEGRIRTLEGIAQIALRKWCDDIRQTSDGSVDSKVFATCAMRLCDVLAVRRKR